MLRFRFCRRAGECTFGTLTDGDVLWGLKELNFPSLYIQMEETFLSCR